MSDRFDHKLEHRLETKPANGAVASVRTVRRIELITGDGRRRRWSDDEKVRTVVERLRPGANVSKVARRNGRPRIAPSADGGERPESGPTNAKLMRAIARARNWRRELESGKAATLKDIADAERITVSFVSRFIRLAYLSPLVLERLLVRRSPSALAIVQLAAAACTPWAAQPEMVFDD